jgi:hypothetical protein
MGKPIRVPELRSIPRPLVAKVVFVVFAVEKHDENGCAEKND